jgi:hypothetical protein
VGLGPAAVGAGDDLEVVPVGVVEVQPAPTVLVIGLSGLLVTGIGVIGDGALTEAFVDAVEVVLADQERIVRRGDRLVAYGQIVELDAVGGFYGQERPVGRADTQPQDGGQELGASLLVAGGDDRVIQLDGHEKPPRPSFDVH